MFEVIQHFLLDPVDDKAELHWAQLRRPERGCDRALTGTTRRWLRGQPPGPPPLRQWEL